MDEIAQLQQLLATAQSKEVSQKLADRNVVELIQTLMSAGKVELLFTLDGKEYVTLARLEREIKDELIARGGPRAHMRAAHPPQGGSLWLTYSPSSTSTSTTSPNAASP